MTQEDLKQTVREFFKRSEERGDVIVVQKDEEAMEHLVKVLLKRETEIWPSPEYRKKRRALSWFFENSVTELRQAMIDSIWYLLKHWADH